MSRADWSFKDPNKAADRILKKADKKAKRKAKKKRKAQIKGFYGSEEWRRLRYRVIRKYKARCMACGRSPKEHGIVVHVDHIKPRSKHPNLELEFNNLQILCDDCNIGKSNIDETDWRPTEQDLETRALINKIDIEKSLDDELLASSPI